MTPWTDRSTRRARGGGFPLRRPSPPPSPEGAVSAVAGSPLLLPLRRAWWWGQGGAEGAGAEEAGGPEHRASSRRRFPSLAVLSSFLSGGRGGGAGPRRAGHGPTSPCRGPAWPRRPSPSLARLAEPPPWSPLLPRFHLAQEHWRIRLRRGERLTHICILSLLPPEFGSRFASSVGRYVFAVKQDGVGIFASGYRDGSAVGDSLNEVFSRPERIVPIAERFGMDPNAVLDNIIYARAYTYEHQYNLLLGLAAKMAEEPFRLLIVDSVIALFRVDFSGRGELAERQQKLAQMLSRLTKIAEEFNVAVYITNQVIADPGGGMFITDPKKPAGGHVLAHAATIRLMLRKGKGEQRVCKIFDAPNLPEGEAVFQVTSGGIMDAKD